MKQNIISSACKHYCSDKIIGCGVSHIMLYKHIQKTDTNSFALILEDDILVTEPDVDYNAEIIKLVNIYNITNPKWNIIRLHSMGFDMGSTAAYIININYINELSNIILHYHIDLQQSFLYKIINLNILFTTRDNLIDYMFPHDNIYIDNQKLGFYMNIHFFQILTYIFKVYHIFYLFLIIIFIKIFFLKKIKLYN